MVVMFNRRNGLAQRKCTEKGIHTPDVNHRSYPACGAICERYSKVTERLTWKNALFSVSSVYSKSFDVYSSLLSQGDDQNSETHDQQNKKWQNDGHT